MPAAFSLATRRGTAARCRRRRDAGLREELFVVPEPDDADVVRDAVLLALHLPARGRAADVLDPRRHVLRDVRRPCAPSPGRRAGRRPTPGRRREGCSTGARSGSSSSNASFWNGTTLIVTSGWALWNSAATFFQSCRPAPWLALCHQTRVTPFFGVAGSEPRRAHRAPSRPRRRAPQASVPSRLHDVGSSLRRRRPVTRRGMPAVAGCLIAGRVLTTLNQACQPISIPFSKFVTYPPR